MLNQEDMKFLTEYKKNQTELENRASNGEVFVWSPEREVHLDLTSSMAESK